MGYCFIEVEDAKGCDGFILFIYELSPIFK
jgi:hypothetical protein